MKKEFCNPHPLKKPRYWSDAVSLSGPAKLVYVSGQVSWDAAGAVVGKGDMRAQCEQVFNNVGTVLRAAGASWSDVIKMNGYMVGMNAANVAAFREIRARYLTPDQLPASTLVGVTSLVQPELLLEVEVIAAIAAP
ncbi:MAG TPA: RidA family protein [Burkholderiales bacterium]|jgi:enamine deaminase RidA (YjgF/YER057c/UK114 family)